MSKACRISIGERSFVGRAGERILDAALVAGYDLPHDCRSGHCGTCRVRVLEGQVLGGDDEVPGTVLACQGVVLSDLRLDHDELPPIAEHEGEVVGVRPLVQDVVELTIATQAPFRWLPGQYANFTFDGFPERAYSPTVALDGRDQPGTFRLHVRRLPRGRVSSEIGRSIRPGHGVTIAGPLGSAYLRRGRRERLVLLSGGTGFAPIWSIADAALRETTWRQVVLIIGARSVYQLYMAEALERLMQCRNVTLLPVLAEPQSVLPQALRGEVGDLAEIIEPNDVTHAAGPPAMVDRLAARAQAIGAELYADRFVASQQEERGWIARVRERLAAGRGKLATGDGGGLAREGRALQGR